jgi:uncharacterized protein
VIEWGRRRSPAADPWLLGFSFGGGVAIRAGARAGARLLVTVAPALDRSAHGEADAAPRGPPCPWLIVQGDADEVIDSSAVLEWAARESAAREAAALPAIAVRMLRGAGHFFHGRLPELREAVVSFVREQESSLKESGAQPVG